MYSHQGGRYDQYRRWSSDHPDLSGNRPLDAFLTILVQVAPVRRELDLQIQPVYALKEHLLGFLYLLRDATEEREFNRRKSEFISTVSHEFRSALTGIAGFSELICEEASDVQEAREFAGDIKADAIRLTSIITNLLDLERMQTGKLPLQVKEEDLNGLLREMSEQVQERSPLHTLRLAVDERLPAFPLDSEKIRQVMLNLLSNAVKYSPNGGEILVSSRMEETVAHVRVQDGDRARGPGMDLHPL